MPKSPPSDNFLSQVKPYEADPGEEYMNPRQRAHFTEILNQWKDELLQDLDRSESSMQNDASKLADPSDSATREEEFNIELRTRDRERKLIKKIDSTLASIEREEYGWCERCGVEIGIARLEARPTASLCVECKTLAEIEERHIAR